MKKYFAKSFLLLLFIQQCDAQIFLNRPLVFTSGGDSSRIENLYTPNDSTAGLNVSAVQNNRFIYAIASGIDSISLTLASNVTSPNKGMIVYFKASGTNNDSVYITLNNSNYFPLYKYEQQVLAKNDIQAGQIILVAFDGTSFRFLSYDEKNCPVGFIQITDEYCIEQNETAATPFFTAVTNCYDKNARLCNWGEWYYACQKTGLGLTNMTNNWEYIDDAGNEVNMIRIAGNINCQAAGLHLIPVNGPRNYRCCYSIK